MNTQAVPPIGPLLAQMPGGRDMYTVKRYEAPTLEPQVLEAMRAPPDRSDDFGNEASSDEEHGRPGAPRPVGSYPEAERQTQGSTSSYY